MVIIALGTTPKDLENEKRQEELEIRGRNETIQTTTLARILRRVLEI